MVSAAGLGQVGKLVVLLAALLLVASTACTEEAPTVTPFFPTSTPTASQTDTPPNPTPNPTDSPTKKGAQLAKQYDGPPAMSIDTKRKYTATINTSEGKIVFDLLATEAPKTVNNFVFLARDGFYDGVVFHRILKGFMIQGGDPTGTGAGGPGYRFEDEPVTREYVPGILAMANAGPNTNGSQFFVMHGEANLPKAYTIFGQVVEGIEVVDALANTPVTLSPSGERSKPTNPPVIEDVEITEE